MPIKLDYNPDGTFPAVPIVYEEILRMTKLYKAGLPADFDDARSAWVSVDELKALINDNEGANGIRIYYGRYEKDSDIYQGQHNVILVATKDSETPDHPTPAKSDDQLNYDKHKGDVNSISYTSGSYTGMGDDTIPLCPPRCPPKTSILSY